MKLEINELYHNYIIRVVIFSIFLYKGQVRQPNIYKQSILFYTKKRIPWQINLKIDTGTRLPLEDERGLILDQLLNNIDNDYQSTVVAKFTTPLKETTIEINLKDEFKYQTYLYS